MVFLQPLPLSQMAYFDHLSKLNKTWPDWPVDGLLTASSSIKMTYFDHWFNLSKTWPDWPLDDLLTASSSIKNGLFWSLVQFKQNLARLTIGWSPYSLFLLSKMAYFDHWFNLSKTWPDWPFDGLLTASSSITNGLFWSLVQIKQNLARLTVGWSPYSLFLYQKWLILITGSI
jgi:hypothetical protein